MSLEPSAIIENLKKQIDLLKQERKEDYRLFQDRMALDSIAEREKKGVTWYPVRVVKDYISTGERITLELEKVKDLKNKHSFQVGAVVAVFAGSDEQKKTLQGVIGYIKETSVRVVLNQSSLPDWVGEEKLGLNLLFDDATYREMERALRTVIEAKNNRLAMLRDFFYGRGVVGFNQGYTYQIPSLNEVQNEAFAKVVDAQDVAFIHGPPGTGKTTTLTKCIKDIVKKEKQVLVAAPSNAAVDLLVEKLVDEGLNVLRIGHPARLTPEVVENSLDVRISKHGDFNRLREMRKQSEEYRSMAGKYKRKFGREEKAQRDMLYKEARLLKHQSRELETYITENLMDTAEVVACTLTGASSSFIQDRLFKTIFIDEASQSLEAACWIPITRVQRVIMSGDHHQLPPTIKSIKAAKEGLEDTLFAKGVENQPDGTVMLQEQYRMEEQIMSFSSQYFYRNKLKTADEVIHRKKAFDVALEFIDTAGASYDEALKQETLSTFNEDEARFLTRLMASEDLSGYSVGVIAPYKAQVELIERKINQSEKLARFGANISVNSVDAFQGQERDLIYISLVRSNPEGEIGFLKEYRRMNVAMTRAKYRLIILGDSSTLGNDAFFQELIDHIQSDGKYSSVYEYGHLIEYI
ncbi:MAG: AAA domain-containing protein [Bacteroidota bacterium]